MLPGIPGIVADEDIVRWSSGALNLHWHGSANGIPENVDIDAIHVEQTAPFVFTFSTREATILPTVGRVEDEDVVRWNGAGFDPTPFFDGSAQGIPTNVNVDGFSVFNPTT